MYTTEYCSVIKEKEILALETTQYLLGPPMLSELSQRDKPNNYKISLICGTQETK